MASFDNHATADKVTSDSKAKIDTSKLSDQAKQNYQTVANAILENGWPNETFPKDTDIDYYTLKEVVGDKLGGIGTILKNMREEKLVEYNSRIMITDETIITLISDYYQEFNSVMITYDRIKDEVEHKGMTSHERANY